MFTQGVDAILANWDLTLQRYFEFRQRTTSLVPNLEPSFVTGEPQGQEGTTGIDATLQASVEVEEAPTLVVMEPPPIEHMEVTTGLTEIKMT